MSREQDLEVIGKRAIWRATSICLAGAAGFVALEVYFDSLGFEALSEFALHVAIAFVVALILIVALEQHAKRSAHRELLSYRDLVAKDVFQAVFRRVVPDAIFEELRPLMSSDVVRKNCSYLMTFAKAHQELSREFIVLRREMRFTVQNLTDLPTEYLAKSVIASEIAPESRDLSSHLALEVNGRDQPLVRGKNILCESDTVRLQQPVLLEKRGAVEIYMSAEELLPLESTRNIYLQATALIGLEIEIRNEVPDQVVDPHVRMLHSGWVDLRRDKFGRYHFDRALLPGHGFEVVWTPANWKER